MKCQFIFIDESGEPSFHKDSPTTHFVLSLLIFESVDDLQACECKLNQLKKKLNFKTEFKFVKSYEKTREDFFGAILYLDFKVSAIVVEN
jgi:hypothetical protein